MSIFRTIEESSKIIRLISEEVRLINDQNVSCKKRVFSQTKTFKSYIDVIETFSCSSGCVVIFLEENKKLTVWKFFKSDDNLRKDLRQFFSFQNVILPYLTNNPKSKFVIQKAFEQIE
jgi:hypothetical protein